MFSLEFGYEVFLGMRSVVFFVIVVSFFVGKNFMGIIIIVIFFWKGIVVYSGKIW